MRWLNVPGHWLSAPGLWNSVRGRWLWHLCCLATRRDIGRIYREVIGRHYPPMSLLVVAALLDDRALVEIEATAVVPESR